MARILSREEQRSEERMELRRLHTIVSRGDANARHLARYDALMSRNRGPEYVDPIDRDWDTFNRELRRKRVSCR